MQKAKEAISSILHKDGNHDADLSQHVSKPVTHEQVHEQKTHHNTAAVDREVHEDHHQTTVQPVKDKEVLQEQHHHNVLPTETKHHHHGKDHDLQRKLHEERGQFQDSTEVLPEQHHHGDNKAAVGEHHHHHIHEHVQPVIEKQTIQPHVVHNVAPVHEVVEKEPRVHKQTVNPAMTMDQFKNDGLGQGGNQTEHFDYEGDPLKVSRDGHVGLDHHNHHHHDGSDRHNTGAGLGGSSNTTGTGGRGITGDSNTRTGTSGGEFGGSHNGIGTGHNSGTSGGGLGGSHNGIGTGHNSGTAGGTGPNVGGLGNNRTNEPGYKGLGENIIGSSNPAASDTNQHSMRQTMRDGNEQQEGGKKSLLDKLTGK